MASFALPPVVQGESSMQRRNYLVERYRNRVAAYEPTRKEMETKEMELTEKRRTDRMAMLNSCSTKTGSADANGSGRPLPGGGPRNRKRGNDVIEERRIAKEQEAQREAAKRRAYRADMEHQVEERALTRKHMIAAEEKLDEAERGYNAEKEKEALAVEKQRQEDLKDFHRRMQTINAREQKMKREKREAQEKEDFARFTFVQNQERRAIENDERRVKDAKRMMQLSNEEYHAAAIKKKVEDKARDEQERKLQLEADRIAAERDRREQEEKKARIAREMAECEEREKEFRRTHNYETSKDVIRERNEKVARDFVLIRAEEKRRAKDQRDAYRQDLLDQMRTKYEYEMSHQNEV